MSEQQARHVKEAPLILLRPRLIVGCYRHRHIRAAKRAGTVFKQPRPDASPVEAMPALQHRAGSGALTAAYRSSRVMAPCGTTDGPAASRSAAANAVHDGEGLEANRAKRLIKLIAIELLLHTPRVMLCCSQSTGLGCGRCSSGFCTSGGRQCSHQGRRRWATGRRKRRRIPQSLARLDEEGPL